MRKILYLFTFMAALSCAGNKSTEVAIETTMGTMEFRLFDETPLHKENFLKQLEAKTFEGLQFDRVIKDFMIQGGINDPDYYADSTLLNEPRVPGEFPLDKGIYHKRGMLGMGRDGNPEMASYQKQIYVVWGHVFTDEELDRTQERLDRETDGKIVLTQEMREYYKTVGGTPHLDGQYTIFGEIIKGMDVLEAIQATPTDSTDHPLTDVVILKAYVK